MKVVFEYGKKVQPSQMNENAIYLDGACAGPIIDNEKNSYSFDHHENCSRFATLAACQQVMLAIDLGWDPETCKEVHLNDLDADTSLALFLVRNPEAAGIIRFRAMVEAVGFVDAHGPVKAPTKLHKCLSRHPRVAQTEEMVMEDQGLIADWLSKGDDGLPEPFVFAACPMWGMNKEGQVFRALDGDFASAYAEGAVVAIAEVPGTEETIGWTIGKRSDFVKYDIQAFLAECNTLEDGWGGGSTIGGAPRLDGGKRSSLDWETVKAIFKKHK